MRILLSLFLILLIPLTSSLVTQNNTIYYGITESDGSLNITTQTLQDTNVLGFVCSSFDCSTTSGTLWSGNIINSGTNDSLILDFPTSLQDQGYGLFFYKSGYISYEVKTTWAGTGQTQNASRYLTKKRVCTIPINLTTNIINNTLNINTNIDSPISHSGPLNYIPLLISSHYSSLAQITAIVEGNLNSSKSINSSIPFSGTSNVNFSFILPDGNYTLKIQSASIDDKCLSTATSTLLSNLSILNSIIPVTSADIIPIVNILSPLNTTYNTSQILINISSINSSSISLTTENLSTFSYISPFYLNFTEGSHTLNALANSSTANTTLFTVSFNVNTSILSLPTNQTNQTNATIPIYLKIESPINTTYSTNNILINITSVNSTDTWFSINNGINITYISPIFMNFPNGSNIIRAYARNVLNATAQDSVSFLVNVTNLGNQTNQTDTTPPASISNLSVIDIGTNFITWNWTNPSNPDFAYLIIYINGINVLNTTAHQYNATGLSSNTSYTISIKTIDFSNNINQSAVNNTQRTLSPSSSNNPGNGGGGSGGNRGSGSSGSGLDSSSRGTIYTIQNKTQETQNNLEVGYQTSNTQKPKNNYLPLILIFSILLVLIILIVLASRYKRRSRARGLTRTT